jgi:hypothetical protein
MSCNYINTDKKRAEKVKTYKDFFYQNQTKFNQLNEYLLNNSKFNLRIGQFLTTKDLDSLTNEKLKELGIESFSFSYTNCEKLEVEYKTTWTKYPIGQMYLSKEPFIKDSIKDTNNKVESKGFIEVHNLGNGWFIWIDSDFI